MIQPECRQPCGVNRHRFAHGTAVSQMYDAHGHALYVKTFDKRHQPNIPCSAEREEWALLAQLPVVKPRLLLTRELPSGSCQLIMTSLPGQQVASYLRNARARRRRAALDSAGSALRAIHDVPVETLHAYLPLMPCAVRVERAVTWLEANEYVSRSLGVRLRDLCELEADDVASLTHGDLTGANVLVSRDASGRIEVGLVDWEFSGVGSPSYDFARLELGYLGLNPAPLYLASADSEAFYSGYGVSREEVIERKGFRRHLAALITSTMCFQLRRYPRTDTRRHILVLLQLVHQVPSNP